MLAVAAVIRMESEGPIFFRQERIGQNNRTFRIFKFRSMRLECSDIHGMRSAARDDDRVSRVGRFIRRTSIDELPQLLNVIIGDMSIVGPRPHALGSLAGRRLFWDVDPRYWQRHSLKPGITGLAQIRGFRGATESVTDLENRLRCDLEYLGSWSIWLDLQIILATFRVVVHHKAY
jgi:lipopolysaccharide/colanic/teichoic acid biosynthesis glycosyltransferase